MFMHLNLVLLFDFFSVALFLLLDQVEDVLLQQLEHWVLTVSQALVADKFQRVHELCKRQTVSLAQTAGVSVVDGLGVDQLHISV